MLTDTDEREREGKAKCLFGKTMYNYSKSITCLEQQKQNVAAKINVHMETISTKC